VIVFLTDRKVNTHPPASHGYRKRKSVSAVVVKIDEIFTYSGLNTTAETSRSGMIQVFFQIVIQVEPFGCVPLSGADYTIMNISPCFKRLLRSFLNF